MSARPEAGRKPTAAEVTRAAWANLAIDDSWWASEEGRAFMEARIAEQEEQARAARGGDDGR